ncbi:hypothetical protein [Stutzerimonas stutzeri]|uniref:hypothetical protein n=1 Tax=Stutzerimonas stutzeri TaxID=316 RepID=UPI000F7A0B2C|nr:hypothetical protein [Stutzerimonas stutzeri]
MNNETMKLINNLREISRRSTIGGIHWVQASPSVFQWDQGNGLIASIQKAIESTNRYTRKSYRIAADLDSILHTNKDAEYLFQVSSKDNKGVMVSLSSRERPELKDALRAVYEIAEKSIDSTANDVLSKLLRY